jgi:hypothetical protein
MPQVLAEAVGKESSGFLWGLKLDLWSKFLKVKHQRQRFN